ncbi:DNA polymerase III subunit chi [Alphaproteobacteria bacterium]|nr:DNA polymerase III subunit chi [Alphaproteobacteria bacterium]
MQVRFYQLASVPIGKALPKLLEKIHEQGQRILVLCKSEEEVKTLNVSLWTYHPTSFLPHGTEKEGVPEEQPIWLSTKIETVNEPTACVTTLPKSLKEISSFKMVIYFFEEAEKKDFIPLWKEAQKIKNDVILWVQDPKGLWVKEKI